MPSILAMKLARTALLAVSFFSVISTTTTSDFSTGLLTILKPSPYLALFSERFCNDMTDKLCHHRDGYWMRYSVYDPVSEECVCSTKPSSYILSKQCPGMTCLSQDERVYYWPSTSDCYCESHDFLTRSWNAVKEKGDNDNGNEVRARPTKKFSQVKQKMDAFNELAAEIEAALGSPKSEVRISRLRAISKNTAAKRQASTTNEPTSASTDGPKPSFIPPPKTDITPELINQSLTVQPQNTATISSVLINIPQGVVTVTFQMNGVIASSISVNASTSMMCGAIGSEPEPEIEIVPKGAVQGQGSNETAVADCLCIAVNMYNPNVINLWVLDPQGRVFALASSNKIVKVDQLDLSQSVALSLVPIPAGSQKREEAMQAQLTNIIPLQTRQVLKVGCGKACPFAYMRHVISADGHTCGCVFEHAGAATMGQRGVVAPGKYSATMLKEECEAIRCVDNGGKAAMFNPFSMVCWCVEPDYH